MNKLMFLRLWGCCEIRFLRNEIKNSVLTVSKLWRCYFVGHTIWLSFTKLQSSWLFIVWCFLTYGRKFVFLIKSNCYEVLVLEKYDQKFNSYWLDFIKKFQVINFYFACFCIFTICFFTKLVFLFYLLYNLELCFFGSTLLSYLFQFFFLKLWIYFFYCMNFWSC